MKIVKSNKWYKKKVKKSLFNNIKISKKVIAYLKKIGLCIGMII